ncbi:MAG: hypothetical protein ABSH51_23320 [Solirubrobacteraceae bacterium]|jgi:hypothetical protein
MSRPDPYTSLEAFIEHDQTDWMGDGVAGQLVTVMMSDDMGLTEPAVCGLWPAQARTLAFELLVMAEHAERLTRHRQQER